MVDLVSVKSVHLLDSIICCSVFAVPVVRWLLTAKIQQFGGTTVDDTFGFSAVVCIE